MGHSIDLSKYQIRTDLTIDLINNSQDGIVTKVRTYGDIKVTDVLVDEIGSKVIGKKCGNYITLEFSDVTDTDNKIKVRKIFTDELKKLLSKLNILPNDRCLIVGLGNSKSTPDSLGPLAVNHVLVTNHLYELGEIVDGFRKTMAIAPSVMANTGIETSDIIKGIMETNKPDFIIVIDALSSQNISRLNKTIQMTDTGIHPGSGIGNSRKELSYATLKVPVIAIGVPTVLDAVTIVSDTIDYMYKHYSYTKSNIDNPINKLLVEEPNYLNKNIIVDINEKKKLFGIIGSLKQSEIRQLIYEVLSPIGYNLMVTPKEVDFMMDKLSDVIGNGINEALHEKYIST